MKPTRGSSFLLAVIGVGLTVLLSVLFRNAHEVGEGITSARKVELVKRDQADNNSSPNAKRDAFVQALLDQMTPEELAMQIHMTFADSVVGPTSSNSLFSAATRYAPLGVVHDWYPLSPPPSPSNPDPNLYNALQRLNLNFSSSTPPFDSHTPIPFMQLGECLHGVGSFKQSMFPSPIALSSSWDEDLVYKVGRAIGTEARSVGIHACLCPVLDLGKEPRWGRVQEAWGEDYHLTTAMGVSFAWGLSKNATHAASDAVVPVVKHFIGHGSPQGGINAAPYTGSGVREFMMEFFRPFKAVLGRGGGRGVMMAYHEFDSVPAHVNPFFYDALFEEWGFDGFVMADDTGIRMLQNRHTVAPPVSSPLGDADTISQWLNAGGGIQFYDFSLDEWVNTIVSLLSNSTSNSTSPTSSPSLSLETLKSRVRGVLNVKWDLGLFRPLLSPGNDTEPVSTSSSGFVSSMSSSVGASTSRSTPQDNNSTSSRIGSDEDEDPNSSLFVPPSISTYYETLTAKHAPLTLEAARKAIVLLENRNGTLPIKLSNSSMDSIPKKIALIGPFGDILNYGDYSGPWGASPVPPSMSTSTSVVNASRIAGTLREGILGYLEEFNSEQSEEEGKVKLVTSVGTNTWLYNAQYGVPSYLLSPSNSTNSSVVDASNVHADSSRSHGLLATYYASTDFTDPRFTRVETPIRDWGLYPPFDSGLNTSSGSGKVVVLPSNNFSVIWEGELTAPVFDDVDADSSELNEVNGFIGVAVGPNTTARLFIDGEVVAESSYPPPAGLLSASSSSPTGSSSSSSSSSSSNLNPNGSSTFQTGTFLPNIEPFTYSIANATIPPPGAGRFTFEGGKKYTVKIEYQTWNLAVKLENVNSVNSQVGLWWNLVEQGSGKGTALPVQGDGEQNGEDKDESDLSLGVSKAVEIAKSSDLVILAVGANWNSDGESGDRGTLGLSANQTQLADAIFDLGIPVVLVLQGGRPFAIPKYYSRAAAVLDAFFPGQSGGQAIADVLFGAFNPGGRIALSVPYDASALPVYYNYHVTRHALSYTDIPSFPFYYFGYGLSYTTFSTSNFNASSSGGARTFASGETIAFHVTVKNEGGMAGSYVAQVYLLARVSNIVRPARQLVAFKRVYLDAGESQDVSMTLDVDEFLPIVNRRYEWELETGDYTFALLENGGPEVSTGINVTMTCVG
ncbi:glycoside hydrolase [Dendrothele bispora CBS 962.96]|uniref:xylan 1,4-beta-xylosidase n=1 Tax=Dendrothele bispora (strain CBS 962.96) TaxID=1314807 RepID=A0A4S8M5N7_DENBC|nr:glycoside hydrolase [Dendrothele bispora CBS 962.96]